MRKFLLIAGLASLTITGCSSVSETIPTVKVERKKPQRVQTVAYSPQNAKVSNASAACDNDDMRARAMDKNKKNDIAKILILGEGAQSATVMGETEVNCRDYFLNKGMSQSRYVLPANSTAQIQPTIISQPAAPAPQVYSVPVSTQPKPVENKFYSVRRGDSLYRIAKNNCTTVDSIARLNGISDPTLIDKGQVLRLPRKTCY